MEQNWRPRNKPTYLWPLNLWQRSLSHSVEKRAFSTYSAGSTGGQHIEECKLILSYALYKARVQLDQKPPHKIRYGKTNGKQSGEELRTHRHRENNLNKTPMAYALRSRINKWDHVKLQSFCKAKDTVKRTKWQSTNWEKTLPILCLIEV